MGIFDGEGPNLGSGDAHLELDHGSTDGSFQHDVGGGGLGGGGPRDVSNNGQAVASQPILPSASPAPSSDTGGGQTETPGAPQLTAPPPLDMSSVQSLLQAIGLGSGAVPASAAGLPVSDVPVSTSGTTDYTPFIVLAIAAAVVGLVVWWIVKRIRRK